MDTRHSKAARAARLKSRRSPAPKRRRTARRKLPTSTPAVAAEPVPEPIQDAIEVERGRLYEAETLLLCTVAAMEGGGEEDGDEPYFPILIRRARELVRTVLRHTDSVNFMQHPTDED
jgi:hypothetical protein